MDINSLLKKNIKKLKGFYYDKDRNSFRTRIFFNKHTTFIISSKCPYTASLVYYLVNKELEFERIKINPNRYITKLNGVECFLVSKFITGVRKYFCCCTSIEDARIERDNLVNVNWDFDLWIEGDYEGEPSLGKRSQKTSYKSEVGFWKLNKKLNS